MRPARQTEPRLTGVRGVAIFEAAKGGLVLLAGLGLLSLIHRDLQAFAEQCVARLHLNPARHMGRILLDAATRLNEPRLLLLAFLALLYASVRFVEAYGLWHGRRWAEWFAVASSGVYVPLEMYELSQGFTWLKLFMLATNLAIVVYLGAVLRRYSGQ